MDNFIPFITLSKILVFWQLTLFVVIAKEELHIADSFAALAQANETESSARLSQVWTETNAFARTIQQDHFQTNSWGVHLSVQKYTKEELADAEGVLTSVNSNAGDGTKLCSVTPAGVESDGTGVLSVVDLEAAARPGGHFWNGDANVQLVSRVVSYNWVFLGSFYSLAYHKIQLYHLDSVNATALAHEMFESSERKCLAWSDSEKAWKASGFCFVSKQDDFVTECTCNDLKETSDAIAAGITGIRKQIEIVEIPVISENSENVVKTEVSLF